MRTENRDETTRLPEPEEIARIARAARAAFFASAFRTLGRAASVPFRRIAESRRRALRAEETYRQLSRLSDQDLNDIGLLRSEIGRVAEALAAQPREARLTITELRQRWASARGEESPRDGAAPQSPERVRRPDPRPAQPANTPQEPERAA